MDGFFSSVVGGVMATLIAATIIALFPRVRAWLSQTPWAVAGLIGGVAGLLMGGIASNIDNETHNLKKQLADISQKVSEIEVSAGAANSKATSVEATLPEIGARIEQLEQLKIPDLQPIEAKLSTLEGSSKVSDILGNAIIAFDQPSGCPEGWSNVGKEDAERFAGRVLIAAGSSESRETRGYGALGGKESHTLTIDQIPAHQHGLRIFFTREDAVNGPYLNAKPRDSDDELTRPQGRGQPHNNMPPFVALYFCKYEGTS